MDMGMTIAPDTDPKVILFFLSSLFVGLFKIDIIS
jgi:hypothetical protein